MLVDVARLLTAYYTVAPGATEAAQRVSFGTSGHRGSPFHASFNEDHILAITQAICDHRGQTGADGPLFLAKDTHALSEPAFATALEVLAANGVETMVDQDLGYTPTPALSHAILGYNRGRSAGLADGIVITPSHNPPADGGIKYNPPSAGPVDTAAHRHDYVSTYVDDLESAVDLEAARGAGLKLCADALGGAGVAYWGRIAERYRLNLTVAHADVDPTFRFMRLDWDGKIRMDCSSPYAMAGLIELKDRFDVAFACDTDHDRHGVVTRGAGLLNPNHYLSVAICYLFANRPGWSVQSGVGKTMVSSGMIDRVTASLGRKLFEVPVGFKWFVDGLAS